MLAARFERDHGRELRTYSYSPPPPAQGADAEWSYIAAICARERISCRYTEVSPADALSTDEKRGPQLAIRVRPVGSPHPSQRLRDGVRVLLSGWGGDELASFHGLGYYAGLLGRGRLPALWRAAGLRLAHHDRPTGVTARLQFILRRSIVPRIPHHVAAAIRTTIAERPAYAPFVERALVDRLRGVVERATLLKRFERSSVRRHQLGMLAYGHLQRRIEAWETDAAGLGVVHRYPLLDRRIAEFALGVRPTSMSTAEPSARCSARPRGRFCRGRPPAAQGRTGTIGGWPRRCATGTGRKW